MTAEPKPPTVMDKWNVTRDGKEVVLIIEGHGWTHLLPRQATTLAAALVDMAEAIEPPEVFASAPQERDGGK